jgi:folylpolyglutamate synthase/dihydropteroate synthase
MHGMHQIDNVRTCIGALLALENTQGFREWAATVAWRHPETADGLTRGFPAESVRRGIARTRWPGRFDIISRHPLDIVDGAHCPLSAEAMVNTFRELYGVQQVILVAGFLRDKMPDQICASIPFGLNVTAIVCCTPPTPRGLPAEEAARILSQIFTDTPIEAIPDPHDAIRGVLQLRDEDQAVLIFGSMYIIGAARNVCREHSTAVSDFGSRV